MTTPNELKKDCERKAKLMIEVAKADAEVSTDMGTGEVHRIFWNSLPELQKTIAEALEAEHLIVQKRVEELEKWGDKYNQLMNESMNKDLTISRLEKLVACGRECAVALNLANELIEEFRGYLSDKWNWKYKDEWDAEQNHCKNIADLAKKEGLIG